MAKLRRIGNLAQFLLQSRMRSQEWDRQNQAEIDGQERVARLRSALNQEDATNAAGLTRETNLLDLVSEKPDVGERLYAGGARELAGAPLDAFLKTPRQMNAPVMEGIGEAKDIPSLGTPQDVLNKRIAQGPIGPRELQPYSPDQQPDLGGLADISQLMSQRAQREQALRDEMGFQDARDVTQTHDKAEAGAVGLGAGQRTAWLNGGRQTGQEDLTDKRSSAVSQARSVAGIEVDKARQMVPIEGDKSFEQQSGKLRADREDMDINRAKTAQEAYKTVKGALQVIDKAGLPGFLGAFGMPSLASPGSITRQIPGFGGKALEGSAARDVQEAVGQIKAALTLENLPNMKGYGQLSDGDREFLTTAATIIGSGVSENIGWELIEGIRERMVKMEQFAAAEEAAANAGAAGGGVRIVVDPAEVLSRPSRRGGR